MSALNEKRPQPQEVSGQRLSVGSKLASDLSASYNIYFGSGHYQSRYPRPNYNTLKRLRQLLPHAGRLLDFGAGEGRYCLPLARSHLARVLAVDVSSVARSRLRERACGDGLLSQIAIVDADADGILSLPDHAKPFDLIYLGFGVLGHVAGADRRRNLLRSFHSMIGAHGHLVLGLPNAKRRFRREQRQAQQDPKLEKGDVYYCRRLGAGVLPMFYHLYTKDEIFGALREAGWQVTSLRAESILPETWVTRYLSLAWLDRLLCAIAPSNLSYGFLVEAIALKEH